MIASVASLLIFVIDTLEIISIFILVLSGAVLETVLESTLKEKIIVSVQFSQAMEAVVFPLAFIFVVGIE